MSYLSKHGYVLKKSMLTLSNLCRLKEELVARPTVDEKYTSDPTLSYFPIYIETISKIYIPRWYGIKKFGNTKFLDDYTGSDTTFNFVGNLRDSQIEPYNCILNACREIGGGILSLMTGGGKSIIALKTISELGKKTIIVVNKVTLKAQWENEIKQFLPNARIGSIQGQKIKVQDCDIIICMLQSLSQINYPKDVFNDIGCTVYDECHNISSRCFSKVLFKTTSRYMIGLSATPERADGLSYLFKWHIGEVVYKSKNERCGLEPVVKLIKLNSSNYTSSTNKFGKLNYSDMINGLTKMSSRNECILEILTGLFEDINRKILVLSDRREHLINLYNSFKDNTSTDCGLFLGSMKLADLEKSKQSRVIFATYKAFGEGVSERDLNTLLLITPKKSNDSGNLDQIVGRIFRKDHLEIPPMIIDLVDNFSVFSAQSRGRLAFYKENISNNIQIEYTNI
jgi:superfamily II DNA or RNA helicase